MKRSDWKIGDYIQELIYLAEILDVPSAAETIQVMLKEMWAKYPRECENNFVSRPT